MSKKKGILGNLTFILLVVGGLNWGLIGFFDFNLIDVLFHSVPMVSKVIYAVVGLAALWKLWRKVKKNL